MFNNFRRWKAPFFKYKVTTAFTFRFYNMILTFQRNNIFEKVNMDFLSTSLTVPKNSFMQVDAILLNFLELGKMAKT